MMALSPSDMPSCGSLVRRGDGLFRCGYVGDYPQHGPNTVYERFIKEMEAMTIVGTEPAVTVVGRLTRAVKRAQMVVNGELPPVSERTPDEMRNY